MSHRTTSIVAIWLRVRRLEARSHQTFLFLDNQVLNETKQKLNAGTPQKTTTQTFQNITLLHSHGWTQSRGHFNNFC